MDTFRMFAIGVMRIASWGRKYSQRHAEAGITEAEWALLTDPEPWSQAQARRVRSILMEMLTLTMTLAGIPSMPVPGQYVAAMIVALVAPINWFVAAALAPEAFCAEEASGLKGSVEIVPVRAETMISLVMAYGEGSIVNPVGLPDIPQEVQDDVARAQASGDANGARNPGATGLLRN